MTEESSKHAVEMQVSEANKLGNALVSGIISDGITSNKRKSKISGSLKNLRNLVDNYKMEADNVA